MDNYLVIPNVSIRKELVDKSIIELTLNNQKMSVHTIIRLSEIKLKEMGIIPQLIHFKEFERIVWDYVDKGLLNFRV